MGLCCFIQTTSGAECVNCGRNIKTDLHFSKVRAECPNNSEETPQPLRYHRPPMPPPIRTQAEAKHCEQLCQCCELYDPNAKGCTVLPGCCRAEQTRMAWTHANCPGNRWEFTPPREGYHGPFSRRNLLFHLCPLEKDQLWRRHAAQLWKYRPIFTGRRIVAIATGKGVLPADQVREALGEGFETVEVPNDPQLREVASFPTLLKEIASLDPTEVTFYAHSKGNSTADDPVGALRWTAMMYSQLLGRWLAATALLEHFASVGTMKIVWPEGIHGPYPTQQPSVASLYPRLPGRWMFAGTFFWFRHSDVFSKPNWSEVLPDRYAAEAWLSGLFEAEEGFSMFQPWPEDYYPSPSPYDPRHYPEYLDWKDGRISSYTI